MKLLRINASKLFPIKMLFRGKNNQTSRETIFQPNSNNILMENMLRIPPELINNLEPIEFSGPINIIEDQKKLDDLMERIHKADRIGFDTESRPAFKKGQKFPVSIIQFSFDDSAFILKLKKLGFTKDIKSILSNPRIEKIGVGVGDDIRRLQEISFFKPAGFTDLAEIAKRKGLIQCGARALTARYLGRKLVKSAQITNWAKDGLSDRQLKYAATDAWICLNIIGPLINDNTDYFAIREAEEIRKKAEEAQGNEF